ncbi:D-alanyl-D-alanine carboxypeptidase/D-alanyl-D-alanine-endopeptidase [Sulfuritalea sp.]|uniref:D-alanyl-D-alanine carboxypeptidase/D-alanyl-D-alanine endopeptidase n=1 Tax=Sulfuritalea sp. TaxID=2480090 RepID=UPI00286E6BF6|nr:D-alanyl-D-alanine carboxypeptidase/D-alanyl-D-alanine-endopeptidase [Sulfuritalea sp.]
MLKVFLSLACWWTLHAVAGDLPAPVAQALGGAGIPVAATAVWVREVDAARPRLAVNARASLNPASTMKLLTTFAALDLLGPAYVWKTEAFANGIQSGEVLNGDLHLKGGGDPKLTYDQFARLLRQIRARGIREIRGDLVLDRSAFAIDASDPARFDAQPLRPYNVAPDALLLNFKSVRLQLIPDPAQRTLTIAMEPTPANLHLINKLVLGNGNGCGEWRERLRADVFSHGPSTRLVLTGVYPQICGEQRWNIAVQEHPQFVLGVFQQLWAELGGSLAGGVREGPVPAEARAVGVLPSATLGEVVRDINKYSNNVMARQLFLTLGMEAGRRPAGAADAEVALRAWLDARGLALPELVLENGAGLSRQERISAEGLGRVLQAAWRSSVMPELMASLPVTATDGTMKKRLKQNGVAGQAHIKTGSLEGVRSLAGYVLDRTGRRWIVVFFVNHANAGGAQAAQDALLQWVYESGGA